MRSPDDVLIAVAAYRQRRESPPVMPAPAEASIEQQGRVARAIRAWEAGVPVYDVVVDAELIGGYVGTASIELPSVLEDELHLVAARAIATLARGCAEQIVTGAASPGAPDLSAGGQG